MILTTDLTSKDAIEKLTKKIGPGKLIGFGVWQKLPAICDKLQPKKRRNDDHAYSKPSVGW